MADLVLVETAKRARRLFNREFKLSVSEWYDNNKKYILQTASKFKIDRKQVRNWIVSEGNIRKQKSKSKTVRGRHAQYSLLEDEYWREFREQRNLGRWIKRWWVSSTAKKIMLENHLTVTILKHFNHWFNGFCGRNKLSLCRKVHISQKAPSQLIWTNMDRTSQIFVLDDVEHLTQRVLKSFGLAVVNLVSIRGRARFS